MPVGHRRGLFRNSHWGGGRASGAARGRPRSECRDGHEDLRRIVRIGHDRAAPAERELQMHFSGSDPLWRFRLEASSTDLRLHKREPFGLRMPMYGERRHFLQFRPPTLPLVDRTRNVPFEKRLRIPRGDLQSSTGFHEENALGLHCGGRRFAAKLRTFHRHRAKGLQISSAQRIYNAFPHLAKIYFLIWPKFVSSFGRTCLPDLVQVSFRIWHASISEFGFSLCA